MRCNDEIAVEPFALGLFGAQQEQMICERAASSPREAYPSGIN